MPPRSRSRKKPTAFVVHGRDLKARDALVALLDSGDIKVVKFHQAAPRRRGVRLILGTILDAIKEADVVIVLFTPDEQAVFYEPVTGTYHDQPGDFQLEGWQARPNVIFEAGVAIGVAAQKTVLVKLGPVRGFSDLGGVHYVDLNDSDGIGILEDRLTEILRRPPSAPIWLRGDLRRYSRRRWPYHPELELLDTSLREQKPYGSKRTLHTMVWDYAVSTSRLRWDSETLAHHIFDVFDAGKGYTADSAFWYLIIFGVLTFKDINGWDAELWWANAVEHAVLTARGTALLRKLEALGPPPRDVRRRQPRKRRSR